MNDLNRFGFGLKNFLNDPRKVLGVCVFVFVISLFLNAGLWKVWGLRRDFSTIEDQINMAQKQSSILDMQIRQAKDPAFIERQARDKLDMVSESDLIFVFPE
jgi:cell division protein FtsB